MAHIPSNRSLDCSSFEVRIQRILDDRLTLTGDENLMKHASQCANCARLLNDYESVDDSIKLLPDEIDKILREARDFDVTNGLGSLASRHFGMIAALATLFVIGMGLFNIMNSDPSELAPRLAINGPATISSTLSHPFSKTSKPKPPRKTPDTSPFSPNFSVANSISLVSLPSVPNWDDVSKRLVPLEPVITYSAEIPGIRRMQFSINATLRLLKESFSKSEPEVEPDLGYSIGSRTLAAA